MLISPAGQQNQQQNNDEPLLGNFSTLTYTHLVSIFGPPKSAERANIDCWQVVDVLEYEQCDAQWILQLSSFGTSLIFLRTAVRIRHYWDNLKIRHSHRQSKCEMLTQEAEVPLAELLPNHCRSVYVATIIDARDARDRDAKMT